MLISIVFSIPVIAALLTVFFRSKAVNEIVMFGFAAAYPVAALFACAYPSGCTRYFAVDGVNGLFLFILGCIASAVACSSVFFLRKENVSSLWHSYFCVFFYLFIGAMTGALLSTHCGLLWVFIEATTLMSAPFIYFEKTRHSLEATWKYLFICSIGIALAFMGIILLSISAEKVQSLFFSDLYRNARVLNGFWLQISFLFVLVGFGTKMGLAPVHAWLPDAHSEAPAPISALLSGALLNTAFLGIFRIFKILEIAGVDDKGRTLIIIMGMVSIGVAAVYMIKVRNYKRMLAYSSIENMGIMALGMGIGGGAVFASVIQTAAHSFIKSSFFLTSGNIFERFKTKDIAKVRGVTACDPVNGWLWVGCFLALTGFPPSPIFWSKLMLIKEMVSRSSIGLTLGFMGFLIVILYGMGISVFSMCFGESSGPVCERAKHFFPDWLPAAVLLIFIMICGVCVPGSVYSFLQTAAAGITGK
ncbi:MAG: proton-conducting transporter membrane subunit [Candidatus Omnitrophica bacterium]|nr:proton-conducting transporter membrane subunit [Candidatus Omnitrophota bacterium]